MIEKIYKIDRGMLHLTGEYYIMENKHHPAVEKGFIVDWLVCGPFPKIGPHPSGRDSFYIDFLKDAGGESNIEPREGLFHPSSCVNSGRVQWRRYTAEPNGFVNFVKVFGEPFVEFWRLKGGVAYAFTTIKCDEPKRAVFLLGSEDSVMVWLNGELVHHNKIGRSPRPGQDMFTADLKGGLNKILVKVARYGGGWGFYLQYFKPGTKLFVNKAGAIIPHLRVGEKINAWASIPIMNITEQRISSIQIKVDETNLFNQSISKAEGLDPSEWRRIPFWISTKHEVNPNENLELKLSVEADGEIQEICLEPTIRSREEWFITTYRSKVDGSIQPFGLYIPTSYDKNRSYPLIVVLHGYKGGWAIGSYTLKEWCIIAGVYARGEVPYREIGERDVLEVIEAVKRCYNIDEDRIYLTGHSMGGSGTWYLGLHKPDMWAAIAPLSAGTDYRLRLERLKAEGEEIPEWLWKIIDENSPMYLVENALNLPVFVSHGSDDKIVHVEHSRRIVAALKKLGYTVEYDEVPGKGHTWSASNRPWWGNECIDRPIITRFFHKYRRRRYPRRVHYKTNSLRFNRAYWVEIDEMNRIYETARIMAEVHDGNVIKVKTENITQYTLTLTEDMGINLEKPLTIITDGSKLYIDQIPRRGGCGKITLRALQNTMDKTVEYMLLLNPEMEASSPPLWAIITENGIRNIIYDPASLDGLRKKRCLFGPIMDAFNSPFVIVWGSKGDENWLEANRRAAYNIAGWWKTYANGDCQIKADINISVMDIMQYNVVLFGGSETNIISERVDDELPIKVREASIYLGSRRLDGDDLSLAMIYPNPLNPRRYILLNASTAANGMENFKMIYSGWTMLPDYVIFNKSIIKDGVKGYLAAGFFDKNWRLTEQDKVRG